MSKTNSWSIRALYLMMALLLALSLSPMAAAPAQAEDKDSIPEPFIDLSRTWGPPGAAVTVTGDNFPPRTAGVLFAICRTDAGEHLVPLVMGVPELPGLPREFFAPIPFETNDTGDIPDVVATLWAHPTPAPLGDAIFVVIVGTNMATADFKVTWPELTVTPEDGLRGTEVTITGKYFEPGLLGYVYAENPAHAEVDVINPVGFMARGSYGEFEGKAIILPGAPICTAVFRAIDYTAHPIVFPHDPILATDDFSVIPFDFSLAVAPTAATVTQRDGTTPTVTATLLDGITGNVTLSYTLPTGVTGITITFLPDVGMPQLVGHDTPFTSDMTIAATATVGTHVITITGTHILGGIDKVIRTTTFTLTVLPPVAESFSSLAVECLVDVSPASPPLAMGINPGTVETRTVSVSHDAGPAVPVTLGFNVMTAPAGGAPGDVAITFAPPSGTPDFTSTMTIGAAKGQTLALGVYTILITGTGGGTTTPLTFALNVTLYDFSLRVEPDVAEVTQGHVGDVAVVIATHVAPPPGLPDQREEVTLTYRLPPGVDGIEVVFSPYAGIPAPVTPPLESIMAIVATKTATPGTHEVTIIGTSAVSHLKRTVTLTLTVVPLDFDFSLAVDPTAAPIPQGASAQHVATVTATLEAGESELVTLTHGDLPDGITVSFVPPTGNPRRAVPPPDDPFTSEIRITATSIAAVGVHEITITGTGAGGLVKTTTFTLTVTPLPFDFSLAVAYPHKDTIGQGEYTTATVIASFDAGVAEVVTLSAALPDGVAGISFTFDAPVVPPFESVMTVTAAIDATVGTHRIVITGTSTTAEETAVFMLMVTIRSYSIELVEGWNLISLPLIPAVGERAIEHVLAGIIGNVTWVLHYNAHTQVWETFVPGPGGLLTEMVDGRGYWIHMEASDTLIVEGTPMPPPEFTPPTYPLFEGWNHIGFTSTTPMTVEEYLGPEVMTTFQTMWGHNAETEEWFRVVRPGEVGENILNPGMGYWLFVSADGVIPLGITEEDLE